MKQILIYARAKLLLASLATLLLLPGESSGQSGWVSQSSGTTNILLGVSFADHNTGTAVGLFGTILRTTNGGATWTSLPGVTTTFVGVCFINADTGTTVGESGAILRTTDGGTTWVNQSSGTANALYGVSLVDANVGTAVGEHGTIIHTTNGGTTWTTQTSGTTSDLNGVFFYDSVTGTVVGGGGRILRTTNGGTVWSEQFSGSYAWDGVSLADANTGIVVGSSLDSSYVARTTNGGTTWLLSSLGINNWSAVTFTDSTTAIAVGGTPTGNGRFCRTTNRGLSWTIGNIAAGSSFLGLSFTDTNTGTAVGLGGAIARTTTGGVTWIQENPGDKNTNAFALHQNYPNPFNATTTISFSLPSHSFVSLEVVDILGRPVATLISEELPAGNHTRRWNLARLSSGIYCYRMKAGNFIETKKLVLLR